MLLDTQNLFSDNQPITTGTIYSTNTIRFGLGDISYLPMIIQVSEDFSGLEKLNVKIQTSEDENFTTSTDLTEAELKLADLKAGATFPISYLPKGNKGYMRICYSVTGTETTGKITAGTLFGYDIGFDA